MEEGDIFPGVTHGRDVMLPQLQTSQGEKCDLPPKRTKLVFLYSSDDEDEGDSDSGANKPMKRRGEDGEILVTQAPALNPPPEELHAMQLEAESALQSHCQDASQELLMFTEDATGEVVAEEAAVRGRVKVVDALPLREHRDDAGCEKMDAPLRRHLRSTEAERLMRTRKRFRDDDEDGDSNDGNPAGAAGAVVGADPSVPRPLVDEDGLVRAIAVGGYQLTVDEGLLQSCDDNAVEGDVETADDHMDEGNNIFDDDDDEDVDDEEAEEELDEAVVVAVVEQLVRCCESDELDEALRDVGNNFLAKAQPRLEQLQAGALDPAAFGDEMRGDILSLLRAFQRLRKPKDEPIVIDGVLMDM